MTKYLIHYDSKTGKILERRPQGVEYPMPIPTPNIIVNEAQFISTLNGTKQINITTKTIEDIPPVIRTLEELKALKKIEIAGARYKAERAGMMFNGHPIATDDVGQNKITGAVLSAMEDDVYMIEEWLCADGTFISLGNADILGLGRALRDHVQDKFRVNKELFEAVEAAQTSADLDTIEWSD